MLENAFINLDLPKPLFKRLKDAATANFQASLPNQDDERLARIRIVMVARNLTATRQERLQRLSQLEKRMAANSAAFETADRIIVLECVDAATDAVLADYSLLQFIVATLENHGEEPPEVAAWAIRYRENTSQVFAASTLDEFALTSLETVFNSEEIFALFSRSLDAHNVVLDASTLAGGEATVLETIEAIVSETVAKIDLSQSAGSEFDERLEEVLS